MLLQYDEYELLDLFESEPIITTIKEEGMYIYRKSTPEGISIMLHLSIHERRCHIILSVENHSVLDAVLNNVASLRSHDGSLIIHRIDSENDFIVYFKPNIYIKAEY